MRIACKTVILAIRTVKNANTPTWPVKSAGPAQFEFLHILLRHPRSEISVLLEESRPKGRADEVGGQVFAEERDQTRMSVSLLSEPSREFPIG